MHCCAHLQAQLLAAAAAHRPVPQLAPLQEEGLAGMPLSTAGQPEPSGAGAAPRVPPLALDRAGLVAKGTSSATSVADAADSVVVVHTQARPAAGAAAAAGGKLPSKAPPVVPPLPRLSQLLQQPPATRTAPVAASGASSALNVSAVHEEKHKKWLEELIGEMNNKRQEQAQQRASALQPLQ